MRGIVTFMQPPPPKHESLTHTIAQFANQNDRDARWPAESVDLLKKSGVFQGIIPEQYGGAGHKPTEMLLAYEAVARGCLSTALVFTQHDAAADIIITGDNQDLKDRLAPQLAKAELQLTVGISQLTTSHQSGTPAMSATCDDQCVTFSGLMPWVTAAAKVDMIVTGGVTPDRKQILAVIPTDDPGISIDAPMETAAVQSSYTTAVHCKGVIVSTADIIRGPAEKALAIRSTVRPLVVSATGMGLAGAMVDALDDILPRRSPELASFGTKCLDQYHAVRQRLYAAADALSDSKAEPSNAVVRSAVNDLVIRLAITLTTLAKGSGYLRSHPAQRLAREAMFFLVWSAPESVQTQTLHNILD